MTSQTDTILKHYAYEDKAVQAQLAKILNHGALGGTGKLVILPVDQGFEHGPARSFAPNPSAYDPLYHWHLAIDAQLSALAAPLGLLEAGVAEFGRDKLPTILKLNSANSLSSVKDQAVTASPQDAKRLGCAAIGLTLYPGSEQSLAMFEEARSLIAEARTLGLASVVWSYPRGGDLSKEGETALDVIAYGAHIAALLGAHIIKVKPPTDFLWHPEAKKVYDECKIPRATLSERVQHIMQSAFAGRRLVVFSGGAARGEKELLEEIREIQMGGGSGSIVGRNAFQRDKDSAHKLLAEIQSIYRS